MDRYRSFLLPGMAALVVLAYYAWRWTSGAPAEPAPTPAPAASTPTPGPGASPDAKTPMKPTPAAE